MFFPLLLPTVYLRHERDRRERGVHQCSMPQSIGVLALSPSPGKNWSTAFSLVSPHNSRDREMSVFEL